MEYVFVGGRPNTSLDYSYASIRLTNNLLISMIDVLNSENSRSKSFAFFKSLYEMNSAYRQSIKYNEFLDSGGYSIIVGDVKASQTRSFIEKYVNRVIEGKNIYDYVFSLDIPIYLNEPEYNTKQHIYEFNKLSLEETYKYAKNDEILRNKIYFVWHFKIKEQYDIWTELYDNLKINDFINNRAAGGMVGLRGITQIDFSPFIAPMFRCLYDYVNGNNTIPFRFHALGVYIQHDRFFLWFLEKLFNYYLKRNDSHITYDSVNYMRTAQLKARDLDIYQFDGTTIKVLKNTKCPDEILKFIYPGNLYNNILKEIDNIKNNKKLDDINCFVPLNIYSNLELDKFFNYIIEKYHVLEAFLSGNMTNIFATLGVAHSHIFTNLRINSLKVNFRKTWSFHQWFIKNRKIENFHPLMYDFIKAINFPASLEEVSRINQGSLDHLKDIII